MARGAVIALSHGGGPMPLMGDPKHANLIRSMKERVPKILKLDSPSEKPRAILVVTAHWSEAHPTISSAASHKMYYDYSGFPPAAYELSYGAAGSPDVAKEVYAAFEAEGLNPQMDPDRGWDHGVFVPMTLIHPEADVPIVQVSVLSSEDPEQHYKMGQALLKLRESNIAIIGSGFASFHNLRLVFSGATKDEEFRKRNLAWNDALDGAVTEEDAKARGEKLKTWRDYPGGHEMHPDGGADHLMPLLVCAGAGGEGKAEHYTDEFFELDMYSWYWP